LESLLADAEAQGDSRVVHVIQSELARRRKARPNRARRNGSEPHSYGFEEGTEAAEAAHLIAAFIKNISGRNVPERAFDYGSDDEVILNIQHTPEVAPFFEYGENGVLYRSMERYLKSLGYRMDHLSGDVTEIVRDPYAAAAR
jgi:hypothetical protein